MLCTRYALSGTYIGDMLLFVLDTGGTILARANLVLTSVVLCA